MGGLWRVLEILLVCGSLAGAGTLGTLAVLDETKTVASSDVDTDGNGGFERTASEISACLSSKGLEVVTADFPTPADATAVGASTLDGNAILVVVFPTEAAAAQFRDAFEGLQPPGGLILDLGNALLAYEIAPDVQTRADVEGCVLGEDFDPVPPEGGGGFTTGDVLSDCLVAAGFDFEDNSQNHPDVPRSVRVTGGNGVLVFIFLFDTEADAAAFQDERYGADEIVHNVGRALVEYESEPDPPVGAIVEGCVQQAISA
jgi:hypothetical protein